MTVFVDAFELAGFVGFILIVALIAYGRARR